MAIIQVTIDTEKSLLEQVQKQLPKPKYFVKQKDVGCGTSCSRKVNGRDEHVFEPLGCVISSDVGKMCVKSGNIWQVENQEQFLKRTQNG